MQQWLPPGITLESTVAHSVSASPPEADAPRDDGLTTTALT